MIAICPNIHRDIDCTLTLKAKKLLEDAGFEVCICPVFAGEDGETVPAGVDAKELSQVLDSCSLVVVIGGDGTILSTARELHDHTVPVLGINMGTKGFMTSLEPEELDRLISAAAGDFKISRRMKLDVSVVRGGREIYRDNALNDAVMHGYGDCIRITLACNGSRMMDFSGDGVILATPTGSTGYSMSAGGPIAEPEAENIIISPICAHVMGSRSFVLSPESIISVSMEKQPGRRAYLSIDGRNELDLHDGDTLTVKRSGNYMHMADVGLRSFYEMAYEKLR